MTDNDKNPEESKGFFSAIGDTIKSAAHLAVEAVVGIERAILPEFTLDHQPQKKEEDEATQQEDETQERTSTIANKEDYKQGFKPEETSKPILTAIFNQPLSETARQAVEKVKETVSPQKPESESRSEDLKSSLEVKPLPIEESKDTVENMISEAQKKRSDKTLIEQGKAEKELKEIEKVVQKEEEKALEVAHEVVERAKHNKEFMEAVLLAEDPLKLVDKDVHKINLSKTVDHKEHAQPHDVTTR